MRRIGKGGGPKPVHHQPQSFAVPCSRITLKKNSLKTPHISILFFRYIFILFQGSGSGSVSPFCVCVCGVLLVRSKIVKRKGYLSLCPTGFHRQRHLRAECVGVCCRWLSAEDDTITRCHQAGSLNRSHEHQFKFIQMPFAIPESQ